MHCSQTNEVRQSTLVVPCVETCSLGGGAQTIHDSGTSWDDGVGVCLYVMNYNHFVVVLVIFQGHGH